MTKRALLLSLAAVCLGAQLNVAAADEVPTFDVNTTCRAESAALPVAGAVAACMADEKAARETLVKDWAKFAAKSKTSCMRTETGIPGVRSYVELLTCLQMARDVKDLPKQ